MTWPNIITFARLISVPGIIWLIISNFYVEALWAILIAGLSDFLDGYLARFLKSYSLAGAYLDPLADKLLLMSVYGALGYKNFIPFWLMFLVVLRDLLILGGISFLWFSYQNINQNVKMRPIVISKLNTFFQVMTALMILAHQAYGIFSYSWLNFAFIITALTTFLSAAKYLILLKKKIIENQSTSKGIS